MMQKDNHLSLSCAEAREFLSDIIDARRGEILSLDVTRLSEPGMRDAVELHLSDCESCRHELEALESIDALYANFAIDEKPSHSFADYGRIARERIASERQKFILNSDMHSNRPLFRHYKFWAALTASGLIAASLAILVSPIFRSLPKRDAQVSALDGSVVTAPSEHDNKRQRKTIAQDPLAPIIYNYSTQDGVKTASLRDPSDPIEMRKVQQHEGSFGYLLFHEPLLGVFLKTTRDANKAANEGAPGLMVERVISGSPAQTMNLRKNDYIVTLNYYMNNQWREIPVTNGSVEEAIKFLTNVKKLGAGTPIMLHIIRPVANEFLFMRQINGTLGEYEVIP